MYLTSDYDNMYYEMDFRPEIRYVTYLQDKRVSTYEQYEEPPKHIVFEIPIKNETLKYKGRVF